MKIYDLAKEYGMKSTELLKIVNEAGIEKKSHLNTLTEKEVLIVKSKVNSKLNNNNNKAEVAESKGEKKVVTAKKEEHIVKEKVVFENKRNSHDNRVNRNDNKNNDKKNYHKENKDRNDNGERRNFNKDGQRNERRDFNKDRNDNGERRNFNRDGQRNDRRDFNKDRNDNGERRTFNRDGQRNDRRDFSKDRNDNGERRTFNRDGQRNERRDFNKDRNDRKDFNKDRNNNGERRNFNKDGKDKDFSSRDNRNFVRRDNKPKNNEDEIASVVTPSSEKPKVSNKGNRTKFDKKKYEKEKKQKEEEKKLRELRSDFRKDDKKKKGKKKEEKKVKDEIVRIEGETIGMITISEEIAIKDLAEKLGINVSDVIKKFFMQGKILTANAILSFEEAEEVAMDYEVIVEKEEVIEVSYGEKYHLELEDREQDLELRAPVITIMGHVDHGKTSLLDALRQTNVTAGEAGGITQKIGAYQVNWQGQKITFIDTPGHEAFTEMRARGANITDISILIVAADDGVKPQTVEAISHAKEAGVPIIVAINKIDKPGADPMRVRTELTEYGLMAPDWGGDTEFVEISAKQRINLEELLETILVTAELLELKANPKKRVKAVVIESRLDPKMGAVADILVQEGELEIGDIFVAGETYGRVRSMVDDRGNKIEKAGLAQPVEITGFSIVPNAGDVLYGVNNDKQAKKIAEDYANEKKASEQNKKKHISLESLSQELDEQQLKELKCIIRADSKGSVEALKESLAKLNNEKVVINIIQASAGAVTEGDVKLAEASNALIIAFNVRPTTPAINEAEKTGVEIRNYNVIYHLTEEIEKAMTGMLDPEFKEVYLGRMELKQVFKITNVGNIAGALVVDGKVTKASKIRVLRDGIIVFDGELASLKRFKDDAKEVVMGQECGMGIKDFNDIKEGDIIESYIMEEIPR